VPRRPTGRKSFGDVAKGAAEDLLDLVAAQVQLARLEVTAEVRRTLKRGLRLALFLPPLLVGYAFAMAALASWLGAYWGQLAALGAVAALQIVVAGIGIPLSLAPLRPTRVLERAGTDIAEGVLRTIAAVSDHRSPSDE